ncbi:hypothetical protein FY528_02695 [Hymenobacter lutimineralis]|uniref:Zf-HC2 domain-containing protein n=1 Tax=Hymenobacter lutimineralis TaxID=2606448 RepID=A0A5D6VCV2_9BACT|nr:MULTISPECIES: hypothetical protein [Hymenobacter]QIX61120.1 hypothetical protein HER32_07975 [Hymenobacter sp. BT18]TYZ13336.1 hypothetical protein FY528_02695 [Hymenobacter lutimineralis]
MDLTSTKKDQPAADANGADCERVNTILDQLVEGRAPSVEDEEYFINHAEDCSPCFDTIEKQQVFIHFLGQHVGRKEAPSALSHHILARLNVEMA